jgi:hypothetical protein
MRESEQCDDWMTPASTIAPPGQKQKRDTTERDCRTGRGPVALIAPAGSPLGRRMRKSCARPPKLDDCHRDNKVATDILSDKSMTSTPVDRRDARCRSGQHAHPYLRVEDLVLCKRGGSSSLPGRIEEPCKPGPFAALEGESGRRSATLIRTSRVFACSRWQRSDNACLGRGRRRVDGVARAWGQQLRRTFYPEQEASIQEPGAAVAAELHTESVTRRLAPA